MKQIEHTSRNVESTIGQVRVYLYISSELPTAGQLIACISDLNGRRGEIEHCAVNRIGVSFSRYLRADINADLTDPDSWRLSGCTTSRLDTGGYNDATDSQKLKVTAAAKQVVTDLFSKSGFLLQVLADNEAVEAEQLRKEVDHLEGKLAEAKAKFSARMARHGDMLPYLQPQELDPVDRMVDEDERNRVFGLGTHTGREYVSRPTGRTPCPITLAPAALSLCRGAVPCPHMKEMMGGRVLLCMHPRCGSGDDGPDEPPDPEDGIEQPPTREQGREACATCELRRTDACSNICPYYQ